MRRERKFCKTLCKIVEKKGKTPCIKHDCNGYIHKTDEGSYPYSDEGAEYVVQYQCDKNKDHKWEVITDSFYEENPVFLEG